MGKKIVFCLILCSLFAAMLLAGCGDQKEAETETTAVEAPVQTDVPAVETEVSQEETVDPNIIVVNTPYGNLYYQEQWAEFMKVTQLTEGDILYAHFAAEYNGADYPLFSLRVGAGEGDPVGRLTDADGVQRDVYLTVEEAAEYAELSAEEQNRLYAMQEELNFVIQNLK